MSATEFNGYFQNGIDFARTVMSGPVGIIVGGVLGVGLVVMLIGMVVGVYRMFRGGSGT